MPERMKRSISIETRFTTEAVRDAMDILDHLLDWT